MMMHQPTALSLVLFIVSCSNTSQSLSLMGRSKVAHHRRSTFHTSVARSDETVVAPEANRLPPLPDPSGNPNDDIFRSIRRSLPVRIQYFMRDSGFFRALIDSSVVLSVRPILRQYPSSLSNFMALRGMHKRWRWLLPSRFSTETDFLSVKHKSLAYGDKHGRQVIQVMHPNDNNKQCNPMVVFIHGGAWGTGYPAMYSLIAQPFLRAEKSVAIVGYRTYPTTDVDGQVNDLERAMDCLRREYPAVNDITLVGHSSGAHISMLGLLSGKLTVDRFVGLSGVYDIAAHYCFERGRGVERISPLAPACGGSLETWRRNSPTQLVATASDSLDGLPPMLICHGGLDTTVPYSSSVNFVNAVHCVSNSLRQTCSLLILPDVEHADTAMHLMFGGETQEAVMDWVAQQTATTSNA